MAIKLGISRDLLRHDDDCPGGEGCECEEDDDCDDDERCDPDEGECVDREDGADRLRSLMIRRYGPSLYAVPAAELTRRAAIILGVRTDGHTAAGALALVTLRADGEWNEEDHPRDEGGKFGSGGGGGSGSSHAGDSEEHSPKERKALDRALAGHFTDPKDVTSTKLHGPNGVSESNSRALTMPIPDAEGRGFGKAVEKTFQDHYGSGATHSFDPNTETHHVTLSNGAHFQSQVGSDNDNMKFTRTNERAARSPTESHVASQSGDPQHVHADTHAANAQRFADNAKAAASGTSPAARSSARKAAESAALAQVAAAHGDHASAKMHADHASAHTAAAIQKADAHRATAGGSGSSHAGDSEEHSPKERKALDRALAGHFTDPKDVTSTKLHGPNGVSESNSRALTMPIPDAEGRGFGKAVEKTFQDHYGSGATHSFDPNTETHHVTLSNGAHFQSQVGSDNDNMKFTRTNERAAGKKL